MAEFFSDGEYIVLDGVNKQLYEQFQLLPKESRETFIEFAKSLQKHGK